MCGRFTLTDPDADIAQQFDLPAMPDLEPRYNIAPTQPVVAVRVPEPGAVRELAVFTWGLIPSWAKEPKMGARMINARSETAAEKPSFRAAFKRRRCLVIADGFYEWQKVDGGKQPQFIHMADRRPFGIAGLWEHWEGDEGSVIESCTLLTTEPNDLLRPIHNRMPVILKPEDYDLWLDPEVQQRERLQPLLTAYDGTEMNHYPVSRFVNSPRNDGPDCIEPVPEQAGLF
jgi:putative SOS response-associated peptidase YedK